MRLAGAILIPLLILSATELGLRLVGYGYPTNFFRHSRIGEQDFLIPNYKFSYRFFPPALARVPVLFRMAAKKPEGTYRIFLFGESAAFGDPDPSYGVGRYLEVLLQERFPATEFEVICVAMTAINSHAILPIAKECAQYDGDLWIIYMGNNEMVGPYGAGTVFGAKAPPLALVRASLAIKRTRIGQLIDSLIRFLRIDASVPEVWTGIDMFSANKLPYADTGRLRAYQNFKGNLASILDIAHQANVPVLLSTVASNLKDCAPFASVHVPGLQPSQLQQWDRLYQQGLALEKDGLHYDALNIYSNAALIDSEFAELQFRIGRCQMALTNMEAAQEAFKQARDHDALAVRADTRINQVLTETAAVHPKGQVVVVDAAQALAERSPKGIPGGEFFYEHVHFTLAGNYELARILAEEIVPILPPGVADQATASWAEAENCDRHLAVTLWDRQRLWKEEVSRTSVPPFTSQSSHEQNLLFFKTQLQSIVSQIDTNTPAQDRRIYEEALERAPDDTLLRGNYAQFLEITKSRAEAIAQGQRICELLPDLAWPYYYVGALMVREKRLDEAANYFERAVEIRDDFVQARRELERIRSARPQVPGK